MTWEHKESGHPPWCPPIPILVPGHHQISCFRMIGKQKRILFPNKILQIFCLGWFSDILSVLFWAPVFRMAETVIMALWRANFSGFLMTTKEEFRWGTVYWTIISSDDVLLHIWHFNLSFFHCCQICCIFFSKESNVFNTRDNVVDPSC